MEIGVRMPDGPSHARLCETKEKQKKNCDMGGVSLCCFVFFLPSFLLPFLHFFFVRSSFLYLLYYPIWVANAFPRENYASDLFVAAAAPATVRPVGSSYPVHLPPPPSLGSSFSFFF
jgi:hypothetical protein